MILPPSKRVKNNHVRAIIEMQKIMIPRHKIVISVPSSHDPTPRKHSEPANQKAKIRRT